MTPRRRQPSLTPVRLLRRTLPWAVAVGVLAWLLVRLDLGEVAAATAQGPAAALAAFALAHVLVLLAADGWATAVALRLFGVPIGYRTALVVRGATYLLGVFNYAAGQGGVGLYLADRGESGARSTAAVAMLLVVNLTAIAAVAAAGLALMPPGPTRKPVAGAVAAAALVLALYALGLAAIPAIRLGRLAAFTHDLRRLGWGGHLRALAARLPHAALLVAGFWLALRLWGVPLPIGAGLALVSGVLFVAALPVSPAGIGTTQAAIVLLLTPWAPQPSVDERQAVLFAFGLLYHAFGVIFQALLGVGCLALLRRRE